MSEKTRKTPVRLKDIPASQWGATQRLAVLKSVETVLARVPVECLPKVLHDLRSEIDEALNKFWATQNSVKTVEAKAYLGNLSADTATPGPIA